MTPLRPLLVLPLLLAPIRAALPEEPGALALAATDARLAVHGLAWYAEDRPVFHRLPLRLKAGMPPRVWSLAESHAGVRLRFRTDSRRLAFTARNVAKPPPPHVPGLGGSGVDLYVDGIYRGSVGPEASGRLNREWHLRPDAVPADVTLYLPYNRPALQEIRLFLESGSRILPPAPYAVARPVVYYGSSITQGSAASNPGMTFPAILGRRLNADFVNLGFAGNGLGEPALARAVAEIDAACFVVDFWANPTTEIYRANLPPFVATLRAKHPRTPIIVTSPYYNPSEDMPGEAGVRQIEKREFTRRFVAAARAAGDTRLTLVDGLDIIPRARADALADGRHANSLGFYFHAEALEPPLRAALGLPPAAGR